MWRRELFQFACRDSKHFAVLDHPNSIIDELLIRFLMERVADGHGIDVIDLTSIAHDHLHVPALEGVHNLKVLWKRAGCPDILEYICDTGPSRRTLSV